MASAHELVADPEEAIRAGQKRVEVALLEDGGCFGCLHDWQCGSRTCPHWSPCPREGERACRKPPPPSFLPFRWRSEATRGHEGGPDQADGSHGGELANLICCLSGAQVIDSGWPVFKGKCGIPQIQERKLTPRLFTHCKRCSNSRWT